MFKEWLPAFAAELRKLAFSHPPKEVRDIEEHHSSDPKNWSKFEGKLKNKKFVDAVVGHPASDKKLQKYTKANHDRLVSNKVQARAPSRSQKNKSYKIKVLPSGRLSCDCKDWQYSRSHKGSDCAHVRAVKTILKLGLVKKAAVAPIVAGLTRGIAEGAHGFHGLQKAKTEYQKGQIAKAQIEAAKRGEPAIIR